MDPGSTAKGLKMHTTTIRKHSSEWVFQHDGDHSGDVTIHNPLHVDTWVIPMEVLIEFVGQAIQSQVIADLEQQSGIEFLRAFTQP